HPTLSVTHHTTLASNVLELLPHYFLTNRSPTTEIYTLSLHDALPISYTIVGIMPPAFQFPPDPEGNKFWLPHLIAGSDSAPAKRDRKSTRLNSSHVAISYAVFCLKKKN